MGPALRRHGRPAAAHDVGSNSDLSCEHAPEKLNCNTRVWVIGSRVPNADDGVYAVCEDYDDGTMTVMTYDGRPGRMLIRIPRIGWGTLGFPPFPANDPRSKTAKHSVPTEECPECNGTGHDDARSELEIPCRRCHGTKLIALETTAQST